MVVGDDRDSIAIADIVSVQVTELNAQGTHYYLEVTPRGRARFFASGQGQSAATRAGFEAVASRWTAFLRDAGQPTLHVDYVAADAGLYFKGFMTVASLLLAAAMWRVLAVDRRRRR
jgi:hypothetical protein